MAIKKICENCANWNYEEEDNDGIKWNKYHCTDFVNVSSNCFNPKEELVRKDEKDKIINFIEKDLEYYRRLEKSEIYDNELGYRIYNDIKIIYITDLLKRLKEKD